MPQPLAKQFPALDLEKAQDQVREAIRRAIEQHPSEAAFVRCMNAELVRRGRKPVTVMAVRWWKSEGTFVDEMFWRPIEVASDYATTRRHLRPDLYRNG